MNILITGGAGFVGSTLATSLKNENPKWEISVLDNLKRTGSELNLPLLNKKNIHFIHGDIRINSDLPKNTFDSIIDCAAEPSVLAGYNSNRQYSLQTNLQGTLNLLEFAITNRSQVILLSTSRIYSIPKLRRLNFQENNTRYSLLPIQQTPGCTQEGITEDFPTTGPRSLYGCSKLSSELFLEEYHHAFGIPTTILRSGVIHGPGQLAKPDQGIITYWLTKHLKKEKLQYIGFKGKQTRDALDARDIPPLICDIIKNPNLWNNKKFNIGGGLQNSTSLLELSQMCQEITKTKLEIDSIPQERPMDIPFYITDHSQITKFCGWKPQTPFHKTLQDSYKTLLTQL